MNSTGNAEKLCLSEEKHVSVRMYFRDFSVHGGSKIINHSPPDETRESYPRVHGLRHPWLDKPSRMDTRIGFPCPFRSVVIDSITLVCMYEYRSVCSIMSLDMQLDLAKTARTVTHDMFFCLFVVVLRHIQRYFSYIVTGQLSSFQILTCYRAPTPWAARGL